jgi:hypothetical protein
MSIPRAKYRKLFKSKRLRTESVSIPGGSRCPFVFPSALALEKMNRHGFLRSRTRASPLTGDEARLTSRFIRARPFTSALARERKPQEGLRLRGRIRLSASPSTMALLMHSRAHNSHFSHFSHYSPYSRVLQDTRVLRQHAFTQARIHNWPRQARVQQRPGLARTSRTPLSHPVRARTMHPVRSRHRGASSPPAIPSIRSFSSRPSNDADTNSLTKGQFKGGGLSCGP